MTKLSGNLKNSTAIITSSSPSLEARLFISSLSREIHPFPSLKKMSKASRIVDFPISLRPTKVVRLEKRTVVSLL